MGIPTTEHGRDQHERSPLWAAVEEARVVAGVGGRMNFAAVREVADRYGVDRAELPQLIFLLLANGICPEDASQRFALGVRPVGELSEPTG